MKELFDISAWQEAALAAVDSVVAAVIAFAPKLIVALVLLGLGWLVGRLLQAICRRVLFKLGADRLLRHLGVSDSLERVGLTRPVSELLARLLFWLVLLTFVIFAVDALGLRAVNATVDRLLLYVPRIAGAAIITFVGLVVGRMTRNLVASGSAFGSPENAARLAGVTNVVIVVTAIVLAVEQLGVETEIVVAVTTAGVAAFGLSMGVAFALGARGVVSHVLAGHFLRQRFRPGQELEVEGVTGVVSRVGTVDTQLEGVEGTLSVPNGVLLDLTVKRRDSDGAD